MGTNYYQKLDGGGTRHIGKASVGWCFSLRVYPGLGINTLQDWVTLLNTGLSHPVEDGEGRSYTVEEFVDQVVARSYAAEPLSESILASDPTAVVGPNGLLRCSVDGVMCVGHGSGTWDYIATDFR